MSAASDHLRFADDTTESPSGRPWKVLVVDDDPEVHAVTRLALDNCRYDGRPVEVLNAGSAAEARTLLGQHDDIALILLDVVMETTHAGLDLVHHIREALGNRRVRIVLRTGQPGEAPARDVVTRFEIDDYRAKTELTAERLQIIVITALRSYVLVSTLAEHDAELLRRNEQLERFTDLASQDLQEPLRNIVSGVQLLTRRLESNVRAADAQLLADIAEAARAAHKTIDSLLEYSRLGRDLGQARRVRLDDVVRDAMTRLRPTVLGRGARISVEPLPVVCGHGELLELALVQLLDNAIRYQQRAEGPRVRITASVPGAFAEVRVIDNGIGIEGRYLDAVFEPFHRLHPPDRFPGSGLGLAIARRAIEIDGGTLTAESTPGVGTEMVLKLPLAPD